MSRGKGKTLLAILAFCTVLAEVSPLTCFQCNALSGNCKPSKVTCRTDIDTCSTISAKQVVAGVTSIRISNACGPCSEPMYYNAGVVSISKVAKCCRSDLCNDQIVADMPDTTQNGLDCRGCFNSSSDSCSDSEETVKCVGPELRCMNASGKQALMPIGQPFFTRGCASELSCQSTSAFREFRMLVEELPACCAGSLCNGDARSVTTREPGDRTSSTVTPGTTRPSVTDNGGDRTSSTVMPGTTRPSVTDNGVSVGCIVGIVVGLLIFLLILFLTYWYCWKRDADSGPV